MDASFVWFIQWRGDSGLDRDRQVPALRSSQVTSGGNSEIVNSEMYHDISNSDNALRKNKAG